MTWAEDAGVVWPPYGMSQDEAEARHADDLPDDEPEPNEPEVAA